MYVERKRARGHLPTIALEHSISWKSKVIGELICVLGLRVAGERSSALAVARPFLLWAAPSSRSARSARRNSTTPIWQTSTSSSTVAALPLRLALLVLPQLLALLVLLQLLALPRLLARKHQPLDVYEKRLQAGRFSFARKTLRGMRRSCSNALSRGIIDHVRTRRPDEAWRERQGTQAGCQAGSASWEEVDGYVQEYCCSSRWF